MVTEPAIRLEKLTKFYGTQRGVIDVDLEVMPGEIAGEARVLKPGDMYIIPGNVEHKARSISGRAVALDIFSPVREEFKY